MAQPVILVVVDEPADRLAVERDRDLRFGADYRIVAEASPGEALRRLEGLRQEEVEAAVLVVDLWLPGMTGLEFLAQAGDLRPAAKRVILVGYNDPTAADPVVEG